MDFLEHIEILNQTLAKVRKEAIPTILNRTDAQREFSALLSEITQIIDKKMNKAIRESGLWGTDDEEGPNG